MARAEPGVPRWALAILMPLALWLALPALTPAHFEGISANSELFARWGGARMTAPGSGLFPLVAEFVYASRPLVVAVLRALALGGIDPRIGFPLLVGLAYATFLIAALAAARAFGRAPWPALVAALLALPGVTTLGYTLNDNIVSGALAMAALAIVATLDGVAAYAAAGLLIGLAFGCRPDALLLAPALAGCAWLRHDRIAPLAVRGAAGVAGAALAVLVIRLWTGLTLADMLGTVRLFTQEVRDAHRAVMALDAVPGVAAGASGRGGALVAAAKNLLCFFGPAGLLLSAIGAVAGLADHAAQGRRGLTLARFKRLILFYLYPAAILLYAFRFAIVVRYFYLFATPFLVLHGAHGLLVLLAWARRGAGQRAAAALLGLALVAMPPWFVGEQDGPLVFAGVGWTPPAWLAWQRSIGAAQGRADAFARDAAAAPATTVLSTDYNDHYFTLLAFARAGFVPMAAEGCPDTAARLVAPGGARARIVATEDPYNLVRLPTRLVRAAQVVAAARCEAGSPSRRALAFFPKSGGDLPDALFATDARQNAALGAGTATTSERWLTRDRRLAAFGLIPLPAARQRAIEAAALRALGGTEPDAVVARMRSRLGPRLQRGHMTL